MLWHHMFMAPDDGETPSGGEGAMSSPSQDLDFDDGDAIFDVGTMLAQVKQDLAETDSDDEDGGPSEEEGELPNEDDVESEDEDEEELEDEDDSEDDSETEDEPDEKGEDEDDEEEESEDEPKAEGKPDPKDEEIQRLRDLVQTSQKQQQEMLGLLKEAGLGGRVPQPQQNSEPQPSDKALKLALFGGDKEEWEKVDPKERAAAEKVARDYIERETKAALDPSARYQEIRRTVLEDVYQLIEPVIQDLHTRKASEVYSKHAQEIQEPEDRQRLFALYQEIPGADSSDWGTQEKAFELAVKLFRAEKKKAAADKKEQKLTAKERQRKARGKPKKGGRSRRSGAAPGKGKQIPDWDPSLDLGAYAEKIKEALE